jgi:hypothetical protein
MKSLVVIFLIFFLLSCSNEKNSSIITIDVQSPTGPELKYLSEIAIDIQYIPLETHPKALMKFVNYLKATDDKFYINTVLELLCFDKSGKFLYKLDQQGRGPNEYVYLSDYDISPGKKQVIVLTRGKLYFYNETDTGFRLEKHIDLKIQPQYCDFIPGEDNILLSFTASTGENKYQCICISPEGDTLFKRPNYYKFTRISKVIMSFSTDNVIIKNNDILRIKGLLTDTMFTITSNYKFIPYMIFNTEGNGFTTDFLANVPLPDMNSGSPAAKYLMLSEILDIDRFLLYRYNYQNTAYWVVYDKSTSESRQFDFKNLLKDDISGGINIEPKFAYNGMLYSWTDALTFKNYMSANAPQNIELKNPERAVELQKMAALIKEDDNHILIVITPKK